MAGSKEATHKRGGNEDEGCEEGYFGVGRSRFLDEVARGVAGLGGLHCD